MNTQSMPALVRAMSGNMPQQAVRQLMQALGNCNQDVNQRGGMNVQPTYRLQNGAANPGTWNPNQYPGLLPNAGAGDFIVNLPGIPGYTNSPWNSVFYGGNQFNFPTSQEFALNNFYGGPSSQIGGAVSIEFASITNVQAQGQEGQGPSIANQSRGAGGTSITNIINQGGGQIIPPDLNPPTVLDPIQYVTGVSVFLSKSRKGITLPQNFAAPLTADDFETSDIPTDLSVGGSQTITIPPIPESGTFDSLEISPSNTTDIPVGYSLSGQLSVPVTKATGLEQQGNESPIYVLAGSSGSAVMRADATVSGTATGTGSLSITKATGLSQEPNANPINLSATNFIAVMRADAKVSGTATGTGSVDLGTSHLSVQLPQKTITVPLGSHKFILNLPSGFNAETCSLTYSQSEFEIDLGDVSVGVDLGSIGAVFELGKRDVNVSVPAAGLTVGSAAGNASVPTSFNATLDLSEITIVEEQETVGVNVSVPADGLEVGSIFGSVLAQTELPQVGIELGRIKIATSQQNETIDASGLSVTPSSTVAVPTAYNATASNLTLSGGNGTNITIDGSSFSIESGGSQAVFSGIKPDDELSQPEMAEEFFVLEDAAVTTSVSTEFALTTPFGDNR
jgi:hypothetical protein